jgi:hypothetical protein
MDFLEFSGGNLNAANGGGGVIAKGAGIGALAKSLYEAQYSKASLSKNMNSLLPFALGALADPEPGQETFGQNVYGSSRWYS